MAPRATNRAQAVRLALVAFVTAGGGGYGRIGPSPAAGRTPLGCGADAAWDVEEMAPAAYRLPVAQALPAPEAAQESAAEAWSDGQLPAMKVARLKALCEERGLSGKGKKAELVARLLG